VSYDIDFIFGLKTALQPEPAVRLQL